MASIAREVIRFREIKDTILIIGESGTGKDLVARALHGGPKDEFVTVDCTRYESDSHLAESELFGHVKGSFTGAITDKVGLFESARGGTVFLDELHRLPISAQSILLRVIQEKKVRRVGGNREYPVNFRLITAAQPILEKLVNEKKFLPDLYYRLNVLSFEIPPLRRRPDDIEPLVYYFTKKWNNDTGKSKIFLKSSIQCLKNQRWRGNVR